MISVIIPTYNRAGTIRKSVESVLNQTYRDIELIIVDDGSKDGTEDIIRKCMDSRIRYIYNDSDKHGPSAARNIGIAASKGEYIAFNDSDDAWLPEKLEKQYNFAQKTKCDVNFCVMQKENHSGDLIPSKNFEQSKCTLSNIIQGSFSGTPAFFGKAECFKNEFFDEDLSCNEDWELLIRLIKNYKVLFYNNILVKVAVTEQSVSSDYAKAIPAIHYIMKKHSLLYEEYPKSKKHLEYVLKYQSILVEEQERYKKYENTGKLMDLIRWVPQKAKRMITAIGLIR